MLNILFTLLHFDTSAAEVNKKMAKRLGNFPKMLYICVCNKLDSSIMPIKKVGMPFEVHPSPKKGDDGKNALYAKLRSGRRMTLMDLENYCSTGYSLRKGDMTRVFQTFEDVAAKFLSQGYTIETPIGVFEPKLEMKRRITNPDEVHHDDVQLEGIQFRAAKSFKKELKSEMGSEGFRYIRKPSSSSLKNNEKFLLQALQKSIDDNQGYTTISSFVAYSGLTDYSARKVLHHWCHGEKPLLKRSKYGHAFVYTKA